jgi:hypothetical protein
MCAYLKCLSCIMFMGNADAGGDYYESDYCDGDEDKM